MSDLNETQKTAWRSARLSSALAIAAIGLSACGASGTGGGAPGSNHRASAPAHPAHRFVPLNSRSVPRAALLRFEASAAVAFKTFRLQVFVPLRQLRAESRAQRHHTLLAAASASQTAFDEVVATKLASVGSPALRQLFGPLAALSATIHDLSVQLSHGHPDRTDLSIASGSILSIERTASVTGLKISGM